MKKIFFYIDTLYRGGAQHVMSILVSYFYKKGYDVSLVNDFEQDDNITKYNIDEKIARYYLDSSKKKIIKNIRRIYKLRKIVKEEKPDIMVSFLGYPNIRFLVATFGVPVIKIVSVRSDPYKEYGRTFLAKGIARCLFLTANGWVFQTPDAVKYFSGKIKRNAKIILNPIENLFFEQTPRKEAKDIITVGRIDKGKNHKMLIEAYERVQKFYPDSNLVIYGDGPLREKLEQYCADKGLREKIQFPGTISDVAKALSEGKMFVLTSNFEGMPNALMEAMAVGIPCISTNCPCGGPRYLSAKGKAIKLVPCNDVEMLSSAIKVVLEDETLRNDMVDAAKNQAVMFREDTVCAEWEQYLQMMYRKS